MATGPAIPILYKGAGPGTHWHVNDARIGGFTTANMAATSNALLRHITNYSYPSAFLSFTTSFAIARSYALTGPAGPASSANPGRVYEVDLSTLATVPTLTDPIVGISQATNGALAHSHDGAGMLIVEVARGMQQYSPGHHSGGGTRIPSVSQSLKALVFAIRDGEVLLGVNVLAAAIVNRHDVY
jgi:hypothetical protein